MLLLEIMNLYNLHSNPEQLKGHGDPKADLWLKIEQTKEELKELEREYLFNKEDQRHHDDDDLDYSDEKIELETKLRILMKKYEAL